MYVRMKFHLYISFAYFACFVCSLFAQWFLGEIPCLLCLITRYGFLFTGIIFVLTNLNPSIKIFDVMCAFLLLSFCFYHLGVENHWWAAPDSCKTILPTLQELNNGKLPNTRPACDTVNFKIFGLSMTLISFCVSALLFWITSINFAFYYKGKQFPI